MRVIECDLYPKKSTLSKRLFYLENSEGKLIYYVLIALHKFSTILNE